MNILQHTTAVVFRFVAGLRAGFGASFGRTEVASTWRRSTSVFVVLCVTLVQSSPVAHAADTVEVWDQGWADVDHYLGWDGVTAKRDEQVLFGDIMLGYGVADGLSAYLGTTIEANGYLAAGASSFYLGVFGTVVDTDHFDLDLFMDIGSGGPDGFSVTPMLELNVDVEPDLGLAGLYARPALPLWGETDEQSDASSLSYDLESVLGGYVTVADGHMLHVEYDMTFLPVTLGGLAFGYNVVLSDAIEMISEVRFDIPEGVEEPGFSVVAGFIATIPGAGFPNGTGTSEDPAIELPVTLSDLEAQRLAPGATGTTSEALGGPPSVDPEKDAGLVFARQWDLQQSRDRVDTERRDAMDVRAFEVARESRLDLVFEVLDPSLEGEWALLDAKGEVVHSELLVEQRCTYLVAAEKLRAGRYFVRVRAHHGGSDYVLAARLSHGPTQKNAVEQALWWRSTVTDTRCAGKEVSTSPKPVSPPRVSRVEGALEVVAEGDERGAIVMVHGSPSLAGVLPSMRGYVAGLGTVVTTVFCEQGKCRATLEPGVDLALIPQYNRVIFEVPAN